ncbi:MAG: hypothetical protein JNM78_17020 [Cyclobacteriaceae bacterium]|nr:hypothetical protein [Cyclobacteriaceae bacterium]
MSEDKSNRSGWNLIFTGVMAAAILVSFLYAFIQHGIANKQTAIAIEYEKLAQETEISCSELKKEYNDRLDQQRIELERVNAMLQKSQKMLDDKLNKKSK